MNNNQRALTTIVKKKTSRVAIKKKSMNRIMLFVMMFSILLGSIVFGACSDKSELQDDQSATENRVSDNSKTDQLTTKKYVEQNLTEVAQTSTKIDAKIEETSRKITVIENKNAKKTEAKDDSEATKLYFEVDGYKFKPGDDAADVLAQLGEAEGQYEAPSCVFVGNDIVYAYNGFEINTAKKDDREVVVGIFFTSDQVTTPQGIKLGSTLEEVRQTYTEPEKEETGQMTWSEEKVDLVIVALNDKVTAISYIGKFGQ